MKLTTIVFQSCFLLSLFTTLLLGQERASLSGVIKDGETGEPLIGANILLKGTGFGGVTDINGRFQIKDIPIGGYIVRVSYLGYKTIEQPIDISIESTADLSFTLHSEALEGQTVVVTAQAQGQNAAINQQLNSQQIVSVVSAAKIQELPDANAAESVGRLPGVSILRNGGEGNQVVIRGVQPKYNAITIDGVRMSSSNSNDRSADLSMISPYSLQGIEVFKTVTADNDPDVIGGTVNFKMKEAGEEREGLGFDLMAQGGYSGLPDAANRYNNYKYVAGVDGRFFDDRRLGILVQADMERRNLTSNELAATYVEFMNTQTDYTITSLNLRYIPRDRQRMNGTVVIDYKLPEGKITLTNFVSSGTTAIRTRGESFAIGASLKNHNFTSSFTNSTLNTIVNTIDVEHQVSFLHANIRLSHTYSETKNPGDWTVTFTQYSDPGLTPFVNKPNVDPSLIPQSVTNDPAQTYLSTVQSTNSWSRDRALTAAVDLDMPFNFSSVVTSVIKFGGKFRYQPRSYVYEQFDNHLTSFSSPSAKVVSDMIATRFPSVAPYRGAQGIPIVPFVDPAYSYGEFLDNDYAMAFGMNYSLAGEMAQYLQDNVDDIKAQNGAEGYSRHVTASTTNNYHGIEHQSAAYVMGTISVGEALTVIPGIRYQDFRTQYSAPQGVQGTFSYATYNAYDTLVEKVHSYWLPDISLRYKPLSWFDLRLAYSTTLAYPDYNAIVPRIDVAVGNLTWNNPDIVPSRSRNYDLYLSFYDNTVGLLTAGGFLKRIDDLIYRYSFGVSGAALWKYYPQRFVGTDTTLSGKISSFTNNPFRVDVYGMEIDWQTHFWYLPQPMDGLVLGINYTHIFSDAQYPLRYLPPGRGAKEIDTSFHAPLIDQPTTMVNVSAGYDYRGFSLRISLLYQSDVYTGSAGSDFFEQLHASTVATRRWDLSVKQQLPWEGVQIFGDLNNISNVRDVSAIHAAAGVPQQMQVYGMSGDLGVRVFF